MPLSALFALIAVIYFSINYDFNKAMRLGILAGVMASVSFSLILAFIIQITRIVRRYQFTKRVQSNHFPKKPRHVVQDPTIYEKNRQEKQVNKAQEAIKQDASSSVVETIMLLMDRELAYEVSLKAINDENMADVMDQNEREKTIHLRKEDEEIHIKISSLTKHTAQVLLSSTKNKDTIREIITILKAREHSFMQY